MLTGCNQAFSHEVNGGLNPEMHSYAKYREFIRKLNLFAYKLRGMKAKPVSIQSDFNIQASCKSI